MPNVADHKRCRILRLNESELVYALARKAFGLPSALDAVAGLRVVGVGICDDNRAGIKVWSPSFAPVGEAEVYPDL